MALFFICVALAQAGLKIGPMLELLYAQLGKLVDLGKILLSPGAIFSLPELACALSLALVFLAWRQWQRRGRVRPRVIWRAVLATRARLRHPSAQADYFYFFVNSLAISGMIGWALLSAGAVSAHVSAVLTHWFGARAPVQAPPYLCRAGLTLVAFLAYELAYYADHLAKHKIPFLWAFHQTHHSAEILTPLTVFRVHPLDTLIFVNIVALVTGLAHGVYLWAAGQPVDLYVIGTANVLTVVFLFSFAQLQHSQFWIPLRGLAGRLILSPAHHQLHHSMDPAHYNCNLGSCLGIWDWAFGTLHVPQAAPEALRFGVEQKAREPHRIFTLLVAPVGNALVALRPQKPE